jgi:hypothetical protein
MAAAALASGLLIVTMSTPASMTCEAASASGRAGTPKPSATNPG